MNKHRLQRKGKKIQGRGFFSNVGPALKDALEETFVRDKINEILSKKKKHGAGLKFL